MKTKVFKNIFGIRIRTTSSEKIILGLIPIIAVLLIWVFVTTGKTETVSIPQGRLEDGNAELQDGRVFTNRTKMRLDGWKLVFKTKNNIDKTFIEKDGMSYDVSGFPVRKMGDGARITLPAGKVANLEFIDKPIDKPTAATASPAQAIKIPIMKYKYEVIETRIFAPVILPSPGEVFRSFPSLWTQRKLTLNILYSFLRVSAGFLVAFIIVFPMSLFMGVFSKFKDLLAPTMLFGGYLPIPALVPLTMCLFGTTETQKVMFLALAFAIYLLPLFVKALEDIDNVYLQTGYTLGASKFQILNKIMLPIAMPKIFDSMRLGFGIGWGYIILAEMVDLGSKGVGTLILTSQRRGPREDIYLVLMAIVVIAFITDKIWEKVGKELFPYRDKER